jgi:hypothetical protein
MQEEALKERADLRDVTVKTEVTGASLSAPDFSAQPNRDAQRSKFHSTNHKGDEEIG